MNGHFQAVSANNLYFTRKLINRESKSKSKEQQEKEELDSSKNLDCLPPDSKESEPNMDLDFPIKTKNDDAKIIELDRLRIDDETRNSNIDLNCKVNDICMDNSYKAKLDEEAENDEAIKSRDYQKEATSKISGTDSCWVLEAMLRIKVEFPKQKVVNLMGEYEDYLEENGFLDIKDVKRRK